MTKDFRAGQIRTTQVIASGSTSGAPSLLIASASSPGVDYGGSGISNATLLANVGTDIFVFISGTSGSVGTSTPGATLFGGDVVVSGSLVGAGGIAFVSGAHTTPGGSDTQVQYNNSGAFGGHSGLIYNDGNQTLTVAGDFLLSGSASIATDLTVTGDLTVNGTTTTVNTTNLTVTDPLVYIASGGISSNQNGGLAIASGSNTADQALVIGRVANDVWGVGKLDVQSGTISSVAGMSLLPLRASSIQLGGSTAAITSSDGQEFLLVCGGGSRVRIIPGSGGLNLGLSTAPIALTGSNVRIGTPSVAFNNEIPDLSGLDTYLFVSGAVASKGTTVRGVTTFGGDVVVSGTLYTGSVAYITTASVADRVAQYLVLAATSSLENERVATAGTGLTATDAGAGSTWTLNIDDSVVATVSGTTFTGATTHNAGLSGSLTQLSDGSSYLIAGSSITITSASNGAITVAAAAGGATSGTFNVPTPSAFVTTASVSFAGGLGFNHSASMVGSDTHFFVSGTIGSKDTSTAGSAVFGGDVYVSGTLYASTSLFIGAADLTEDADGDLTVTAGRVVFSPSESVAGAFQVVTNGSAGIQLAAGSVGLGLNSGNGILTLTSSQVVVGTQSDEFGDTPPSPGTDTSFFVSGSLASKGTAVRGAATFGGDVVTSGTLTAESGLSGSLTQLSDGTSYLIAGANITITSASNGAITIVGAAAGGGATSGTFNEPAAGAMATTASVSFAGGLGFNHLVEDIGTDTFFFVSGTIGSKNTAVEGTSVFGGDIVSSGTLTAESGLSGSLTQLSDGTSYLIAGSNVTVTSASNGAITIASTATGGATSGTFNEPAAGAMATTASVSFAGGLGFNHLVEDIGTDAFFFVSGTIGSKDSATAGVAVFGGDIAMSGTLTAETGLSGSLTQLSDGTSYLIAGSNVTITSASNGAVTVASTGGGAGATYWASSVPDSIYATGSIMMAGSSGFVEPGDVGTDVYNYISGTVDGKDGAVPGVTVFNGDTVMSGAIYGGRSSQLAANYLNLLADLVEVHGADSGDTGTDVNFLVSGTINSAGSAVRGTAAFTGDVVVSGTLSTLNGIVGGSHYGGIYNFDNAAAQTLGVGDAEVVDWNNIGGLAMSGSSGITISPSTNKMTVTAAGTYSINFSLTFNGSANSEYRFYVKVNSANQDHITVDRLLNSTGDITSATSMGISVLAENDVVELWVEAGTTTVTIRNSSFMLHQIA